MDTYIAILLMIVPGFLSRMIYKNLNTESKATSDFEKTVISLVFSVFIMVLVFMYFSIIGIVDLADINTIISRFSSSKFIIFYVATSLVMSFYSTYFCSFLSPYLLKLLNFVRNKTGRKSLTGFTSIFGSLADGKPHLIKIERNGKIEYGFLNQICNNQGTIDSFSLKDKEAAQCMINNVGEEFLEKREEFCSLTDATLIITDYNIDKYIDKKTDKIRNYPIRIFLGITILVIAVLCSFFGFLVLFNFL